MRPLILSSASLHQVKSQGCAKVGGSIAKNNKDGLEATMKEIYRDETSFITALRFECESVGQLTDFLRGEQNIWSNQMPQPNPKEVPAALFEEGYGRVLQELNKRYEDAIVGLGVNGREVLERFSKNHPKRLLSHHILADGAILKLASTNPVAAIAGLALQLNIPESRFSTLQGFIKGAAEFASFVETEKRLGDPKYSAIEDAANKAAMLLQKTEGAANEAVKLLDGVNEAKKQTIDGLLHQARESLKLKAPVEYWTGQAKVQLGRRDEALNRFRSDALVTAVGAAVVVLLALVLIGVFPSHPNVFVLVAPPAALSAIALLWMLRYRAREYLDAAADLRDAEQRVIQLQTYVAMATEKADKEEKVVALTALFRPGPSQVGDDGIPLPLIELLKK